MQGANDVYAAGDATTFPIKQGGLATQQADAVAGSIGRYLSPYLARLTAAAHPEPEFGIRIEIDDIEELIG